MEDYPKEQFKYPSYLAFSSPELESFANKLKPYALAFVEGGILPQTAEGWENVFFHCLSEALTADIIAEALNTPSEQRTAFVVAAFLHDAYKRREIEKMQAQPNDVALLYKTDHEAAEWLRKLGYSDDILDLERAFGNNAALQIYRGEITELPPRILHYIDDITDGDAVIPLEERLTKLEHNPKYAKQNEASREKFDGMTLYQAKRIINGKTERELGVLLHVDGSVIDWIRTKRYARLQG